MTTTRSRTLVAAGVILVIAFFAIGKRNPGSKGCIPPEPPTLSMPLDDFSLTIDGQQTGAIGAPATVAAGKTVELKGAFDFVGDQEVAQSNFVVNFVSYNPYDGVQFSCGGGILPIEQSGQSVSFKGTLKAPTKAIRTMCVVTEGADVIGFGYVTTTNQSSE